MRVIGNLDLQDHEVQNVVVKAATNFPDNPKPGHLVFKQGRLMLCQDITNGIPVWIPLTQEITSYIHNQGVASTTWTINHNFNTNKVIVQVSDTSGKVMIPDSIDISTINTAVVSFATAESGVAIVMLGTFDGNDKPNVVYEQEFTNTNSIIVSHNLGYEPIIRTYIDNVEVQPNTIVHDSVNQATVTFSESQTGVVRCI
jgi:hypothetical protein